MKSADSTAPNPEETTEEPPDPQPLKGLWSVMGQNTSAENEIDEASELPEENYEQQAVGTQPPPFTAEEFDNFRKYTSTSSNLSHSLAGLVFGIAAVLFSFLATSPNIWMKFPSSLCGVVAVLFGLTSLSQAQRLENRNSELIKSVAGILLGLAGMFLGPTVWQQFGDQARRGNNREFTASNLESLGTALQEYHDINHQFPTGDILKKNEKGETVPHHGWLSSLLPYLGQEELFQQINFDVPYNDPQNSAAMTQNVEPFFAAGSSRKKTAQGFGITHFAGIAGETIETNSGLGEAGIFDNENAVRRQDIVDGLSQTFVAGEISHEFPAWGQPGNWRRIGKGLNQEFNGFGNAAGDGAFFLMADGSVKFFSNKTSADVLKKLSTRDGNEAIPAEF